ncbi:glycosyltransferase involved in cell wall biosynthesis [Pedobacter sp. UYEF25]
MKKSTKLAIITCCLDDWGGSEELWAKSIPHFLQAGIKDITVYKKTINNQHLKFKELIDQQITLKEISLNTKAFGKLYNKSVDGFIRLAEKFKLATYQWNKLAKQMFEHLKNDQIDFAIISQGINFDGLVYAQQCILLNIPYVLISHKAVDFFWPQPTDRAYMKNALSTAKKCFFVSEHNLKMTEEQFGTRLKNAQIIINPYKFSPSLLPFPSTENGFRLACVGRLFIIDKGQDILLRILKKPKWKERAIHISFIGTGPDEEALKDLCLLFDLRNVQFIGFEHDLKKIWQEHHALVLPSRSEGLPLTITEAMSYGRMAVATNAGGNAETVKHLISGFIGEANEKDFDAAMEEAWQQRENWETMGAAACAQMKLSLPENPAKIFADMVLKFIS